MKMGARGIVCTLLVLGLGVAEANIVVRLQNAIKDMPTDNSGMISRHAFFTKVYDPARGDLVKVIRALWTMAKITRSKDSIRQEVALKILDDHVANAPFWEPCACSAPALSTATAVGGAAASAKSPSAPLGVPLAAKAAAPAAAAAAAAAPNAAAPAAPIASAVDGTVAKVDDNGVASPAFRQLKDKTAAPKPAVPKPSAMRPTYDNERRQDNFESGAAKAAGSSSVQPTYDF